MGGSTSLGSGGGEPGLYGTLGTPASANVPGSRRNAVTWTDTKGNLWLFGGYGDDSGASYRNLNDLWEFNPSTKKWVWVSGSSTVTGFWGQAGVYGTLGKPAAGNVPSGRFGAVGWADSQGNLWLFGGWGCESDATNGFPQNNCRYNDLWEFNPSSGEWAWMEGSDSDNQPGIYTELKELRLRQIFRELVKGPSAGQTARETSGSLVVTAAMQAAHCATSTIYGSSTSRRCNGVG